MSPQTTLFVPWVQRMPHLNGCPTRFFVFSPWNVHNRNVINVFRWCFYVFTSWRRSSPSASAFNSTHTQLSPQVKIASSSHRGLTNQWLYFILTSFEDDMSAGYKHDDYTLDSFR
jgi:hypothetical protein